MRNWIKVSFLTLALLGALNVVQAQKFGYVNSAAILAEMPEVKQADANLEALQKQLQKKGQGMLEKLQEDFADVRRKVDSGDLSPKQQEEESKRLQAEEAKIAQFEQDMIKQVQDKREELLGPIYEKVNQAIADVAKEEGYQFIFDQGVLLFAEESQDVSTMVKAKLGI
jgi:outer membrane protein